MNLRGNTQICEVSIKCVEMNLSPSVKLSVLINWGTVEKWLIKALISPPCPTMCVMVYTKGPFNNVLTNATSCSSPVYVKYF